MLMAPSATNIRQATIVLLSLPAAQAIDLLSRLGPGQAAAVLAQISANVGHSEQERLSTISAFMNRDRRVARSISAASAKQTEHKLFDRRAFQFLSGVEGRAVATLLADEHPQTIAFVLAHLPAERAQRIAARLAPERRTGVLHRMATIDPPRGDLSRQVASALNVGLAQLRQQRRSA
jgi:flagellar motor switch protein FliG